MSLRDRRWNAFVEVSHCPYDELTPVQRVSHLAFLYMNEVLNGGHFQYFENQGLEWAGETLNALQAMGARGQVGVFQLALEQYRSRARTKVASTEAFVAGARAGEYDGLDLAFQECRPDFDSFLKAYLDAHESEFVIIEEGERS